MSDLRMIKLERLSSNTKHKYPEVINEKNVKVAQELISNMRSLDFAIADEGLGAQMEVSYLNHFNEDFDTLDWNDRDRARMTLDKGLQLAANNPVKEQLRPIVTDCISSCPTQTKQLWAAVMAVNS